MLVLILAPIALIVLFPGVSFAYIDPGTGGYVFSSIGQLLAIAGGCIVMVLRPVRNLISKFFHFLRSKTIKR